MSGQGKSVADTEGQFPEPLPMDILQAPFDNRGAHSNHRDRLTTIGKVPWGLFDVLKWQHPRLNSVSDKNEILQKLSTSVMEGNSEGARNAAAEALSTQLDPLEALEDGLAKGLRDVGRRFEAGEMFLMQLILSGEAMKSGLEVLKPELLKQKKNLAVTGKFMIGTVEGDIHDIGKSIVAAMLTAEGFDVIDVGADIPDKVFVEKTKELKPDILGLSALMTTTSTKQKDVIEALKRAGIRNSVKVMVGGATVTPEWAQETGADGYAEDAIDATKRAKQLLGEQRARSLGS